MEQPVSPNPAAMGRSPALPPGMIRVEGGVTAPRGFLAAGVQAGIRKTGKKDVALIYSEVPAQAAGVFTTNRVKAAPVVVSMEHLASGRLRAIVANSGNANACTGERGLRDARRMAALVAEGLGVEATEVAVASTGVIGVPLPMERVEGGVRQALTVLSRQRGRDVAEAIMTTDTMPKEIAVEFTLGGNPVRLAGVAKGSGMIRPNMATMLSFITTDARLSPDLLRHCVTVATEASFNLVTVDGDTSTNDCVLVLANGAAGAPPIEPESPELAVFQQALAWVTRWLARSIARDGEGATKLIEVVVSGARSLEDARKAAMAVANSPLVKTAVAGADANWGRILAALGYSGAEFSPERTRVQLGPLAVFEGGVGLSFSEEAARAYLEGSEIRIEANLGAGEASATAWGCDLTGDYVKINGSYRT